MGEPWGIYCRISKARDGSTLGVERQEPPCRAMIERLGGIVTEVYTDNDLSGYSGKRRPAYERMLADAATGRIVGIAAWHPDRLTRQPIENERLIGMVDTHGIKLVTVLAGEHNLATSAGRMMFRQLGTLARYESDHKGERLRLHYDALARRGERVEGGKRAFGFRGNQTVPEEVALIQEAAQRLLEGDTLGAICRDWKARGVTTTTGATFRPSSLRNVLRAPRLWGGVLHKGEVVAQGTWEPILDRGTWEQVQRLFDDPTRRAGGAKAQHLLSGLLICGHCGTKLYHRRKPGRETYDCMPPSQGGCGRISIDARRIESYLEREVLAMFDSPKFQAMLNEGATKAERAQRHQLGAKLVELEASQRVLADDYYLHRVVTRPAFLATTEKLEAEIADTRRRLDLLDRARLTLEMPKGASTLREAWAVADMAWKREAVRLALKSVKVLPKVPGARPRFTPDRLEATWRM